MRRTAHSRGTQRATSTSPARLSVSCDASRGALKHPSQANASGKPLATQINTGRQRQALALTKSSTDKERNQKQRPVQSTPPNPPTRTDAKHRNRGTTPDACTERGGQQTRGEGWEEARARMSVWLPPELASCRQKPARPMTLTACSSRSSKAPTRCVTLFPGLSSSLPEPPFVSEGLRQ